LKANDGSGTIEIVANEDVVDSHEGVLDASQVYAEFVVFDVVFDEFDTTDDSRENGRTDSVVWTEGGVDTSVGA
jgi:hypothetical protein